MEYETKTNVFKIVFCFQWLRITFENKVRELNWLHLCFHNYKVQLLFLTDNVLNNMSETGTACLASDLLQIWLIIEIFTDKVLCFPRCLILPVNTSYVGTD